MNGTGLGAVELSFSTKSVHLLSPSRFLSDTLFP